MSRGVAKGAIPYKKVGLRLDALPRRVIAVWHCGMYKFALTDSVIASTCGQYERWLMTDDSGTYMVENRLPESLKKV